MVPRNAQDRLIRSDLQNSEYVTWHAPEVREDAAAVSRNLQDEQDDLDQLHRQAWDEGFAEGRMAGLAAGQQELTETAAALECVLNVLARPLEELDVCVEEEIVALVKAVSGQLVRREFKLDPSHIVGVIREGIAALPLSSGEPVIRLHPDDADVIEQCLATSETERAWRIEADPIMDRGGCLIITAESQVDCRLETRLGRVLATMFEGERVDDE
jgi:flagellar assembly protein FliH